MSESKPYVVVVWGDSIAAQKWPENAETRFNVCLNTGRFIKVINKGVGGMPAAVARTQFAEVVLPNSPDLVIIQFGFNDLRYDGSRGSLPLSTPPEFEEHLTEMIRMCREKAGAKVLVFGNHRPRRLMVLPSGRNYDEARADYSAAARRAADKAGAHYRDMAETFEQAGEAYSTIVNEDGVHLSPFGIHAYAAIAAVDIRRIMYEK